jgi:hypothetical protein
MPMKMNPIVARNNCRFLAVVLIVQFSLPLITTAGEPVEQPPNAATSDRAVEEVIPMSDNRFWAIVDASAKFESDPGRQLVALRSEMGKLLVPELLAYEAAFDGLMRRSYTWELRGAAYVVHGDVSDEEFAYFRCWLISKGRKTFEKVLADPDSLADVLVPEVKRYPEFESFAYVARKAWTGRTGRKSDDMPNAAPMTYTDFDASGIPYSEDPAELAKQYPKLWKRFGKHPLP